MTTTNVIAADFRTSFRSVVARFFADFCAGAREGRAIESRYHALCRRSAADLARLGLTRTEIARIALTGHR